MRATPTFVKAVGKGGGASTRRVGSLCRRASVRDAARSGAWFAEMRESKDELVGNAGDHSPC